MARLSATPTQLHETVTVELPNDSQMVWNFLEDPRSSIVLSDRTLRAERLTGTRLGLGQVQLFIHRAETGSDGSMLEVVAYEPGRRAVTRDIARGLSGGGCFMEMVRFMPRRQFRKLFWDLGWGGRGMDVMFALAFIGAIIGGVVGAIFGAWPMGAGLGALVGLAFFAGLVVWAHWGRTSPDRRH